MARRQRFNPFPPILAGCRYLSPRVPSFSKDGPIYLRQLGALTRELPPSPRAPQLRRKLDPSCTRLVMRLIPVKLGSAGGHPAGYFLDPNVGNEEQGLVETTNFKLLETVPHFQMVGNSRQDIPSQGVHCVRRQVKTVSHNCRLQPLPGDVLGVIRVITNLLSALCTTQQTKHENTRLD